MKFIAAVHTETTLNIGIKQQYNAMLIGTWLFQISSHEDGSLDLSDRRFSFDGGQQASVRCWSHDDFLDLLKSGMGGSAY